MNQSAFLMKWFCRISLTIIAISFTYVVAQPSYNFAHWVPHDFLRMLGVKYQQILWAESNADIFLHFFGAALLTLLTHGSNIRPFNFHPIAPFGFICLLCICAEVVQHLIGRGIETSDLLLGICGSFMAYLAQHKNN